ncbi:hypothetical protein V500_02152 [Pseudogymnoascus sp. VKM F-4518 (FW-2643)]|nr:hypothetical protein V500_02152 [Pseudogymnoascus sp. VKM F-4518 (FW-2643)]
MPIERPYLTIQEYESEPVAQYGHSAPQQQQHGGGYLEGPPLEQHNGGGYQQQQPPPQQYGGYSNHGNHQAPSPSGAPQGFGSGLPHGYNFQYSNFTGRRKALLIGINYFGQRGELESCINNVKNISLYLFEKYMYKREDTVILTDDLHNPMSQPTKQNILMAMHWLVKDARPNDALFFCYCGHGGQTKVFDGNKPDGYDEVIYPVDFREVGHIVNHEMHRIMVTPLLTGVRLTAIVDSCYPSDGGSCFAELLYNSQAATRHEGIIHNVRKQKIDSQFSTEEKIFSRNDALTWHMRVVHPSHTLLDKILVSPQQKPEALSNHVSSSYMPLLLPASAAAFALRTSSVNVVLGSKVEPWLTQTLKRINRIRRPLNSVLQHQRCLTETLSSADAIWTLASIMLHKTPDSGFVKDPNPLIEALFNFQLVHIKAYVLHVDMVLRNEVAFKLTPDSIEALTSYHKEIHCDIAASTCNWLEKDLQVKKLHGKFIKAINKFVYRTNATALEGLEEEGVGELLCSRSNEVKSNIMNLFLPLLPPPLSHQTPGPDKDYEDFDSSLGQTQALNLPFPLHITTATADRTIVLKPAPVLCDTIITTDPVSSNPGSTNGPSTAPFQQAVPAQPTQLAKRPAASRTQFSSPNEGRLGDEIFDPNAQSDGIEQLKKRGQVARRGAQAKQKHITPFVRKLDRFVNNPKNDELIRWSERGDSFVVLNKDEFAKNLIPELFNHNNYTSFVRQLNMYGFHKRVGLSDNSMKASERKNKSLSEYYNPYFKRGHPNLLWLIKRK